MSSVLRSLPTHPPTLLHTYPPKWEKAVEPGV